MASRVARIPLNPLCFGLSVALISLSSGLSFNIQADSTILQASSNAGVNIPYSCKTGRCSTCKCRVIKGITSPISAEIGLSEEELSEGWILSCVRTANEDVLIEVDDLSGIDIPPAKTLPCRISHISRLNSDVLLVRLKLPPTAHFKFIAGQYIDIIGPNGVRRSYSLANSSRTGNELELHIKHVPDGVLSNFWFNRAEIGDLLRLKGPLGTFFLRDVAGLELVFLATGTGIAPILSMLDSLTSLEVSQKPKSVTLFWGGRTQQDFYIDPSNIMDGLLFVPVPSRPHSGWDSAGGYVQDVFLASHANLSNSIVYACGSNKMIKASWALLAAKGLPSHRFFSDAFVSSSL